MSGREQVLGAVRAALAGGATGPEVPRAYRAAGAPVPGDAVARFAERVADYRATVREVAADEIAAAATAVCAERGARRIGVPPGLPWRPDGVEVVEDAGLAVADLDALDGVLTGCALAIAETGTIVLDGGVRSGRRALTLVPDHHVCVVEAGQVVPGVPEAIAALRDAVADGRPITFVSGPSATSDIELERVEGVHGPRVLDVLVVR